MSCAFVIRVVSVSLLNKFLIQFEALSAPSDPNFSIGLVSLSIVHVAPKVPFSAYASVTFSFVLFTHPVIDSHVLPPIFFILSHAEPKPSTRLPHPELIVSVTLFHALETELVILSHVSERVVVKLSQAELIDPVMPSHIVDILLPKLEKNSLLSSHNLATVGAIFSPTHSPTTPPIFSPTHAPTAIPIGPKNDPAIPPSTAPPVDPAALPIAAPFCSVVAFLSFHMLYAS